MRVVYLAHPVSGAVSENLARAERWLRWACLADGVAPIAPWMEYVRLFAGDGDGDEIQRDRGISRSCDVAARCDELWLVGGEVSAGMRSEARFAAHHGVVIYDLTCLGGEPPGRPPWQVPEWPTWAPAEAT